MHHATRLITAVTSSIGLGTKVDDMSCHSPSTWGFLENAMFASQRLLPRSCERAIPPQKTPTPSSDALPRRRELLGAGILKNLVSRKGKRIPDQISPSVEDHHVGQPFRTHQDGSLARCGRPEKRRHARV